MRKYPPFQITPLILNLVKDIAHELGILHGAKLAQAPVKLRRENKIKTIQASLAIEGNSLTIQQVTDIVNGKRVIGDWREIKEVNNALQVYKDMHKWNPTSLPSIKKAHKALMQDLIMDNGQWRCGGVGIFKGKEVVHMAPPASRVNDLMEQLFGFIKADKETSWLIKACVFHYELEFIHPFSDGNGRIGRLWQQLLLMKENMVFEFIPAESIIKANQKEYYKALSTCDKEGESTAFIEFSLAQILTALRQHTSKTVKRPSIIK